MKLGLVINFAQIKWHAKTAEGKIVLIEGDISTALDAIHQSFCSGQRLRGFFAVDGDSQKSIVLYNTR